MRTQPAKLGPPVPEPVAAELEHKEPQHGPLRMSLWRQAPGRGEALVISRHEANAGASARSWTERPSWSFRRLSPQAHSQGPWLWLLMLKSCCNVLWNERPNLRVGSACGWKSYKIARLTPPPTASNFSTVDRHGYCTPNNPPGNSSAVSFLRISLRWWWALNRVAAYQHLVPS